MRMPLIEFIPSFFDGGLALRDCWRWLDGERERCVTLIPSRQADLPCRRIGGVGAEFAVDVPLVIASIYDPLAWLIDGYLDGEFATGQRPEARADLSDPGELSSTSSYDGVRWAVPDHGSSLSVPLWQWRVWCMACPWFPIVDPSDVGLLIGNAAIRGRSPRLRHARAGD